MYVLVNRASNSGRTKQRLSTTVHYGGTQILPLPFRVWSPIQICCHLEPILLTKHPRYPSSALRGSQASLARACVNTGPDISKQIREKTQQVLEEYKKSHGEFVPSGQTEVLQ